MEIWKDIIDFEGIYQISNLGRVKRLEYLRPLNLNNTVGKFYKTPERILKQGIARSRGGDQNNGTPYYRVYLSKNGKKSTLRVHRELAKSFIPNPNNLTIVDHIDRNSLNNNISNLRWVTNSENCINVSIVNRAIKNNRIPFRHIDFSKTENSYQIRIRRNSELIFRKRFSKNKWTLQQVIQYRDTIVYPKFNMEIDDS